jgi:hypothetical protein
MSSTAATSSLREQDVPRRRNASPRFATTRVQDGKEHRQYQLTSKSMHVDWYATAVSTDLQSADHAATAMSGNGRRASAHGARIEMCNTPSDPAETCHMLEPTMSRPTSRHPMDLQTRCPSKLALLNTCADTATDGVTGTTIMNTMRPPSSKFKCIMLK